jgi:hypothetical protein
MKALLHSSRRSLALAAFLTCAGIVLANAESPAPNFVGGKDEKAEKKADEKKEDKKAVGGIDIEEIIRKLPPSMPKEQVERFRKSLEENQKRIEEAQKQAAERAQQQQQRPQKFPRFGGRFGDTATQNRLGVRFQAPDDTLIAQLGLADGNGIVLVEVPESSVAAKVGFMASDILLKLNGKDVSNTLIEFTSALDAIKVDVPFDAVVLRKGKEETIKGIKLPEAPAEPRPNAFPRRFQINPLKR